MEENTTLFISEEEAMQMRAISAEKRLNDYEMDIATNRGAAFREGFKIGYAEGYTEVRLIRSMYENGIQLEKIAVIAKTTVKQVKKWLGL